MRKYIQSIRTRLRRKLFHSKGESGQTLAGLIVAMTVMAILGTAQVGSWAAKKRVEGAKLDAEYIKGIIDEAKVYHNDNDGAWPALGTDIYPNLRATHFGGAIEAVASGNTYSITAQIPEDLQRIMVKYVSNADLAFVGDDMTISAGPSGTHADMQNVLHRTSSSDASQRTLEADVFMQGRFVSDSDNTKLLDLDGTTSLTDLTASGTVSGQSLAANALVIEGTAADVQIGPDSLQDLLNQAGGVGGGGTVVAVPGTVSVVGRYGHMQYPRVKATWTIPAGKTSVAGTMNYNVTTTYDCGIHSTGGPWNRVYCYNTTHHVFVLPSGKTGTHTQYSLDGVFSIGQTCYATNSNFRPLTVMGTGSGTAQ